MMEYSTPYELKERLKNGIQRDEYGWYIFVLLFLLVICIGWIGFIHSFGVAEVNGTSMSPTLADGDVLLMSYGHEKMERGDIIVIDVTSYQKDYDVKVDYLNCD